MVLQLSWLSWVSEWSPASWRHTLHANVQDLPTGKESSYLAILLLVHIWQILGSIPSHGKQEVERHEHDDLLAENVNIWLSITWENICMVVSEFHRELLSVQSIDVNMIRKMFSNFKIHMLIMHCDRTYTEMKPLTIWKNKLVIYPVVCCLFTFFADFAVYSFLCWGNLH